MKCAPFLLFLVTKFSPRITEKRAARFLGLLKAACQTFMFCVISTCNAIIPQKNRENEGFRISWPPYISDRFYVTDALKGVAYLKTKHSKNEGFSFSMQMLFLYLLFCISVL